MTVRGPLGIRRPFAEQMLEVNYTEGKVEFKIRGPFGCKRYLAHPNPGVTDEEMAICMQGQSSNNFIRGLIKKSPFKPSSPQEARDWQRSYCEGTLESLKAEDEEPMFPMPDDLKRAIEGNDEIPVRNLEEVDEEDN